MYFVSLWGCFLELRGTLVAILLKLFASFGHELATQFHSKFGTVDAFVSMGPSRRPYAPNGVLGHPKGISYSGPLILNYFGSLLIRVLLF